jgi:hypothetical protein
VIEAADKPAGSREGLKQSVDRATAKLRAPVPCPEAGDGRSVYEDRVFPQPDVQGDDEDWPLPILHGRYPI